MAVLATTSYMENWATPEKTHSYFEDLSVHPDKKRLFDNLTVSALGAGTYLGNADDATDRSYELSLIKAAISGVNFFDTAINYRCMRSEKVLQKVLKEIEHHGISRSQVVIATKGGYLPCEGSPDAFDDYLRTHYLDTKIISSSEIVGGCHCISPAFLDNQVSHSLKNLNVDCIDLYYVHNPETQLQEVDEKEFYLRLTRAFELLEQKVQEKKIARYGIATWNGLRQKANQKTSLQLSKVIACALEAGGEKHHFKAVQMPYNLVMLEAIKQPKDPEQKSLSQLFSQNNLSLMVSSPLMQSHAMSLPRHVFERLPQEEFRSLQSLQFLSSTPSVCTLFAGMKKFDHLQENCKLLSLPNWPQEQWEAAYAFMSGSAGSS